MFEDFFENNAPVDEEKPSEESREQIRTAVMERISRESEDKKMKHRFMRPFVIVAAAVSVSAASLVTANAATNGALVDTITKPFTIFLNGEPVEVEAAWTEVREAGDADAVTYTFSEDGGYIVSTWVSSEDNKNIIVNEDGSVYFYDGEAVTSEAPDAAEDGDIKDETYYWTDADGDIETIRAGEAEADADGAWEPSEDAKSIVVSEDGSVYFYDGEAVTSEAPNAAEDGNIKAETYYWTDADGDIETINAGEAEAYTSANKDDWTVNTDKNGESSDVYYYQYDGEKVTVILAEEYNSAEA